MTTPRILGDFKILRELGRGGMGVVYLARQLSLVREVALKLLEVDGNLDREGILRFQREAALLGRLSHPNIVRVFVVGEAAGYHYLAMEYVPGVDLERALRERQAPELPAAFREDFLRASLRMARDLARGLGAAHAAGIVHRDVKPSNILIAPDGRVCLADFGLARDMAAAALTTSRTALGTPYYMSPEQYGAAEPTAASDVYGLGAVLYECICGKRVFDGATPAELMARIVHDEPVLPRRHNPAVSRDLQTIVLKCLEKDPQRRYPEGYALAADLTRLLEGEPIEAAAVGPITQALRRARRRKAPLPALVAVVLLAALGFGWAYRVLDRSRMRELEHQIELALGQEKSTAARLLMDELLERYPDAEATRFARAELALRERRFADAGADFERLTHGFLDPEAARIGAGFVRSVVDHPEELPPIDEHESATVRQAFYRSIIYQSRGQRDLALAENRRALAFDPDYVEALYSFGVTCVRLNVDLDAAEDALSRYDKVRSRDEVQKHLGNIQWMKGNYPAALGNYERYLRGHPDAEDVLNNVAAVHLAQAANLSMNGWKGPADAEIATARAALDRARAVAPGDPLVLANEAVLRILEHDFDGAEDRFDDALAAALPGHMPDDQLLTMWVSFAFMLNSFGEVERAAAQLESAARCRPDFKQRYYWVHSCAGIYHRLGRTAEAIALLDEALAGSQHGAHDLLRMRDEMRD